MALTPIVVMIKGDFLYHLIAVDSEQTIAEVSELAHVIGMGRIRLDCEGKTLAVRKRGATEALPPSMKIADVGLQPMDGLELYPA